MPVLLQAMSVIAAARAASRGRDPHRHRASGVAWSETSRQPHSRVRDPPSRTPGTPTEKAPSYAIPSHRPPRRPLRPARALPDPQSGATGERDRGAAGAGADAVRPAAGRRGFDGRGRGARAPALPLRRAAACGPRLERRRPLGPGRARGALVWRLRVRFAGRAEPRPPVLRVRPARRRRGLPGTTTSARRSSARSRTATTRRADSSRSRRSWARRSRSSTSRRAGSPRRRGCASARWSTATATPSPASTRSGSPRRRRPAASSTSTARRARTTRT